MLPTRREVTTQVRFFRVCACGVRHTALMTQVTTQRYETETYSYGPGRPLEARTDVAGNPIRSWKNVSTRLDRETHVKCGCGRAFYLHPVKGTIKAEVKCDSRCTDAKGFCCECSCGGKNHGAGQIENA